MIDKVNNITSGNTQNKRSVDENRVINPLEKIKLLLLKKAHLILIMLKLVKS